MGSVVVFGFYFWVKGGGIREGADGKNVVFQERAVAESLVDFRRRASGYELFVGGSRAGVCHGGLERLGFLLFLGRPWDAFAAQYIFRTGVFVFTWEGVAIGSEEEWVTVLRLWGVGGGCHCCWMSSRRDT